MAAKKTPTVKPRYFAQVDEYNLDFDTGRTAVFPVIATSKEEATAYDEADGLFEITKRQYDKLEKAITDGVFVPRLIEEVQERTRGAGDYIWAILIFGLGVATGGVLF
jgi:hypothetical protein